MAEPDVPEFYDGLQTELPNSLYVGTHFQEHIEGLITHHRWRIDNLRTIIRTHRNFSSAPDDFEDFTESIAGYNEQINSIRTVLDEKDQRINMVVYRLEEFVVLKVDIRQDHRRYPENKYDDQFDEVDKNIEMVKYQYQVLSRQLEELARFSLKAIDVLQEHKTAARSSLTALLLRKSQSVTNSLYATVNPRGEFEEFDDEQYELHMQNAGMLE